MIISKIRFLVPLLGLLAGATVQGCANSAGVGNGSGGTVGGAGGSTGGSPGEAGGSAGRGGGTGTSAPKVTIIGSGS